MLGSDLILLATMLAAVSGVPGLLFGRWLGRDDLVATGLMCTASVAGLTGAWVAHSGGDAAPIFFPWPAVGNSVLGVDALSAFFLVPVFLVGGVASIYGLGYWSQRDHARDGRYVRMFWGLLVAGMSLLVVSRHAVAFLLGWEIMALSAFFLIAVDHHRDESRRAGWLYLIATHLGTLALFAFFALWRWTSGSYAFAALAHGSASPGVTNALVVLMLIGFGLKAGTVPLHFWLPGAHANAPSHVSALLSGVMLKMGIYGLVRFLSLLPEIPSTWGGVILAMGAVSGLLGVVFAIGQHDLKRLLAYHSIENIGIIMMGLGLAVVGRSVARADWIVLGMAGCLLHVWNHALFKSLLFLCAGSVDRATHTRRIDRLGGLVRAMPWTASTFLVGAVAICGLPPLNGFVSEILVFLGLVGTAVGPTSAASGAAIAAPLLAMIGALAVACFVKVYGAVFLGSARVPATADVQESPSVMCVPMVLLAACCLAIGLAPTLVAPVLDGAIASWLPVGSVEPDLVVIAPLRAVSASSLALTAFVGGLWLAFAYWRRAPRHAATWDCGYAAPTARMQYTASSFAQSIVGLFGWVLRPQGRPPRIEGTFPGRTELHTHVDDLVLDRCLVPATRHLESWFAWFHRFQQGLTQQYVLYVLVAVILMLSTLIPLHEVGRWLWR